MKVTIGEVKYFVGDSLLLLICLSKTDLGFSMLHHSIYDDWHILLNFSS